MKILAAAAFAVGLAPGFALAVEESVDLNDWIAQGGGAEGGGSWTIQAGGDSVFQSVNGTPTVFHNGVDSRGQALKGTITVETTGDDDFIGFVLGYNAGEITNGAMAADFLLIDWKQNTQNNACTAGVTGQAGLSISRVARAAGTALSNRDMWCHQGQATELARANTLGATGWVDNRTYDFDLVYTSTDVQVFVDGALELSIGGDFGNGAFGFYNHSQGGVRYAGLTEREAPKVGGSASSVPLPAALPLLGAGLAGLGFIARRRRD